TPASDLDGWSERASGHPGTSYSARFEPREAIAGDVARAAAYVAVVYESAVDAASERRFLTTMLADLKAWNHQDPPDDLEVAESDWVAGLQGTANPFVLDPTLLDRAFGDYLAPSGDPDPGGDSPIVWINEIHYDNAGADVGEFIEVASSAGTDLDGWRIVLYNGANGSAYDDRALAGVVPDLEAGLGVLEVTYSINGIQNGPSDGAALVDPDGRVVQFVCWEGTLTATDGPAQGLTSIDVDVQESGATPIGHALRLSGSGRSLADFAWSGPGPASPGRLNASQSVPVATALERRPLRLVLGLARPNPSTDSVRFSLDCTGPVRATVLDALGRRVAVVLDGPSPADLEIDVSALPPGAYALRVVSPCGLSNRSFTVVR
ncbi:endonuclease, partial [Rubrivirga sp.]|uniref:endonuclease n=1 Tax=Rubrivirga sp. TaxID=1885344 RepID=UPI003C74A1FC